MSEIAWPIAMTVSGLTVEKLWRQSMMTAQDMMSHAKEDIDKIFGDGYAVKHPELVVAYMNAANYDLRTMLEYDRTLRRDSHDWRSRRDSDE